MTLSFLLVIYSVNKMLPLFTTFYLIAIIIVILARERIFEFPFLNMLLSVSNYLEYLSLTLYIIIISHMNGGKTNHEGDCHWLYRDTSVGAKSRVNYKCILYQNSFITNGLICSLIFNNSLYGICIRGLPFSLYITVFKSYLIFNIFINKTTSL